jgi:nitroreductase/ferredoxin
MPWEDLKPIFRPEKEHIHMGKMAIDKEKCTSCGLCIENCPGKTWEFGEDEYPRMKESPEVGCMSCYNCMAACPVDAVSIVEAYCVTGGFWATDSHPLEHRMPLEPKDADGNPDRWNSVERLVYERRSVRNYKADPVPESLIWRVIEAGRFAPSAGNCQPWKFTVITDKTLIKELEKAIVEMAKILHATVNDDEQVKNVIVPMYEVNPNPGGYDTRVRGGTQAVSQGILPVFMNAPVVILMACDDRAIGGREQAIGICGQNMTLVASSLGIKACWIGFSALIEMIPPLKERLGIKPPFTITSALVLGYPSFKQEGIVPREFRPVTWFRSGSDAPELLKGPKT